MRKAKICFEMEIVLNPDAYVFDLTPKQMLALELRQARTLPLEYSEMMTGVPLRITGKLVPVSPPRKKAVHK